MSTEAQIAANRQNAQLSTGPRTTEGKVKSSANAMTHGLTSEKLIVKLFESDTHFIRFRAERVEEFKPVTSYEWDLTEELIFDLYQLKRSKFHLANILNKKVTNPETAEDDLSEALSSSEYRNACQYRADLLRAVRRTRAELKNYQVERHPELQVRIESKDPGNPYAPAVRVRQPVPIGTQQSEFDAQFYTQKMEEFNIRFGDPVHLAQMLMFKNKVEERLGHPIHEPDELENMEIEAKMEYREKVKEIGPDVWTELIDSIHAKNTDAICYFGPQNLA